MPADIAGEVLGGALRFIGRILFELLFELVFKGTGNMILRVLRPRSRPGEMAGTLVGLLFWGVMIGGGILLYRHLA